MRLRGHKQQKWINTFIQFSLFVSSWPCCQAEFWYIESGPFSHVFLSNWFSKIILVMVHFVKSWVANHSTPFGSENYFGCIDKKFMINTVKPGRRPAISNSVNSKSPIFQTKIEFPLIHPYVFSHLLSAILNSVISNSRYFELTVLLLHLKSTPLFRTCQKQSTYIRAQLEMNCILFELV